MFVWRTWVHTRITAMEKRYKIYKMLLLFGFIPLFISIDGK